MINIDIEKFISSLIERSSGLTQQIFHSDLLNALKEQGLEYKNGKIVKTQRRVAAEAKEALYTAEVESEDERIRKLICSSIKEGMPIISPKNKELALAWLEKQVSPQMVADAYLKGCNDTEKKLLKKQGKNDSQVTLPTFTFDDVLALQCCMETVKKVQKDEELYNQLQNLHSRLYDSYWIEKQGKKKSIDDLTPQEAMDIAVEKCFEEDKKSTNKVKQMSDKVWSEEDEKMFDFSIKHYLDGNMITWLKSLKERLGGK